MFIAERAVMAGEPKRQVFFISDGTGLTASSYGKSLLAQFRDIAFETKTIPFVDTIERAHKAAERIRETQAKTGTRPIVFSTLVKEDIQRVIEETGPFVIDLFNAFIGPLEKELGAKSAHTLGHSRDVFGDERYQRRIEAIEFALSHDDGVRVRDYDRAEIIVIGVSRCGKTPTSLYLAMNFSLKACNYPLTGEELERETLPAPLAPWREKLIGLTIDPKALSEIRMKRRPSPEYASLAACRREVRAAERIFQHNRIPVFDSTATSIEELAGNILKHYRRTHGNGNGLGNGSA